ncbi:winged helix-turn-helix transcriptional regulator [Roseobacter sinensis]
MEAEERVGVFAEVPVRVEYALTTDGQMLYAILAEMCR